MSFIYDDNKLLEQLLVSGINSVVKQAQNKLPTTPTDFPAYHVADALNVQLQRQLGVPSAPPKGVPLGTEKGADGNPVATTKDLKTLGDFILWCADKKLTWEGQRFAWNTKLETAPQSDDVWDFGSMDPDRKRDPSTREALKVPAAANVNSLTGYLSYLRDNETNQITRLMISKLIGELNTVLTTGNRKTIEAVSKPENKSSFADTDVIDGFTSATLSAADVFAGADAFPFFTSAAKKLTYGDIKSDGNFKSWLRSMSVVLQDKTTAPADKPSSDAPCIACNILYQRAKYLVQYASSADNRKANYSKLADAYLKAITEFGSKLTGANGKTCAVTTAGTTAGTGTAPAGAQTNVSFNEIQKVIATLPLRVETLDFDKINQFFTAYAQLNPGVTEFSNPCVQYMRDASDLTIGGNMKRFNLMVGPREVITWLKSSGNYVPFVNQLQGVINKVGEALQDLKARYADTESGKAMIDSRYPTELARIDAQINGSNSIWQSNNDAVGTWLAQVSQTQQGGSGSQAKYKYTY